MNPIVRGGPFWTPITPQTGSFSHAESHSVHAYASRVALYGATGYGAATTASVLDLFETAPYLLAMPDDPPFRPASKAEIAAASSFALRYDGRKCVHHADQMMPGSRRIASSST